MKLWESPLRSVRSASVVAWAVAVLVFLNSLQNGWAFDDLHILLENPGIQSLESLPEALGEPYWPGEFGAGLGLWRPAVTGFYGLAWEVWGDVPVGYHAVSILLHGGVTVLVVLLLGALLPVPGAFLAGLLFAVHPLHVEAVANVVGMAELFSAFFFLLACLLILGDGGRPGLPRFALVLILYALAVLSKESAITLPGVVLLLDSSREELTPAGLARYLRRRWPLYAGMILVAGLLLTARFEVLGSVARPFAPLGAHLLEEVPRIWTVTATWPHLFRLLFFPMDLVVDYGPAVIPLALGWNATNLLGVALVLATLLFALLAWRRGPLDSSRLSPRTVGWGVVWFGITLSPTSNLFFLSGILLSERTLYLPTVGFVAAAAWLLLRFHDERPRGALALMALVLALLAGRSWTRTPTWKDNLEVFNTLINEHPESGRSQWILGDVYLQAGRTPEALRAYRAAVGIIGAHYTVLLEVGRRLLDEGYDGAGELLLTFAWTDWPRYTTAPGLLAALYDRQGRFLEAETAARAVLAEDSTRSVLQHVLARALAAQGRLDEAREARLAAIRHGEGAHWEQWGWLAELELRRGDTVQALRAMDSARARGGSVSRTLQIDSFFIGLGLGRGPVPPPETARDSQNPRPKG